MCDQGSLKSEVRMDALEVQVLSFSLFRADALKTSASGLQDAGKSYSSNRQDFGLRKGRTMGARCTRACSVFSQRLLTLRMTTRLRALLLDVCNGPGVATLFGCPASTSCESCKAFVAEEFKAAAFRGISTFVLADWLLDVCGVCLL